MAPRTLENKLQQKNLEVKVLDAATQETLRRQNDKDRKFRFWQTTFFIILFTVGISGLFYQNWLATKNRTHIDCIVKLLATPSKSGQTRHITDLETCQIKVS